MRILLICLLLTACAAFDPEPYNIIHPVSTIKVSVDPMLTVTDYKGDRVSAGGVAYVDGDKCTIVLRDYPICLAHEMRHCLEGAWHPKQSKKFPGNDDDCWQDGMMLNEK